MAAAESQGPLYPRPFTKPTAPSVKALNDSLPFDRRFYHEDIAGSIAHARMLGKQGIIPNDDARSIVDGLASLNDELARTGGVPDDAGDEDIHTFVERRLHDTIGEAAGRLHTARSRNDQVALDLRMWARGAVCDGIESVLALQAALLDRAEQDRRILIPAYPQVQRGQPVLLSHHWRAYFEMLTRDVGRLEDTFK